MNAQTLRRSLRLDAAATQAALDRLDAQDAPGPGGGERYRYRHNALRVELDGPAKDAFAAPARWLSAKGLGFLHGCLLYQGTRCEITLITLHGTWERVPAVIQGCRYGGPHVYDVTLAFAEPIEPSRFASTAVRARSLIVSDDGLTLRLLTAMLKKLNADVATAGPADADVGPQLLQAIDLVMLDLDAADVLSFVDRTQLRLGATGADIVGMTADQSGQAGQRFGGGFDNVLIKPVQPTALEQVVAAVKREPIISTLSGDASCAKIVTDFVSVLETYVVRLREAARQTGDGADLKQIIHQLGRHGRLCGFDPIARQADLVQRALEGSQPSAIWGDLRELFRVCARVTSGAARTKPGAEGGTSKLEAIAAGREASSSPR